MTKPYAMEFWQRAVWFVAAGAVAKRARRGPVSTIGVYATPPVD